MSIIKQNQSAFDYATQTNGDARAVIEFCLLNGLGLTQDLAAGTSVESADISVYKNDDIVDYFQTKKIELTTGTPLTESLPLGIGTMIIESSFDVL